MNKAKGLVLLIVFVLSSCVPSTKSGNIHRAVCGNNWARVEVQDRVRGTGGHWVTVGTVTDPGNSDFDLGEVAYFGPECEFIEE